MKLFIQYMDREESCTTLAFGASHTGRRTSNETQIGFVMESHYYVFIVKVKFSRPPQPDFGYLDINIPGKYVHRYTGKDSSIAGRVQ